jgi:hypothetical protein
MIKQAPFKPTDIGGCQLWLDGADATSTGITLSGTSVTSWNDKSGNAYNLTQGTSGSQPSYSANLITFSSNKFLNIPQAVMNNAATWSLFFVINPISSSNWIMVKQRDGQNTYNVLSMTINTNSGGGGQTGSTGFLYWRSFNAGSQAVSTAALTTSTLQICNLTYDGTNLYFYKNGVLEKTTTGTFAIQNDTNATNYTLGVWIQGGGFVNSGVTNFQFGELNFYSSFLNLTQRQQVEAYLAQKWGLRQQLPQGHPGTRGIVYPSQPIPTAIYWRYPSQFVPTSIGGCQIWLDAADSATFTLNGSTVSTWMDKTGNGFNVSQASAGSQPTRGSNEVVFNGSTSLQYSGSVGIFGNSYTSYVIHTPTNNTSYQQGVISIKDSTTGFDFEIGQFYVWNSGGSIYYQFTASVNSKTILGITSTTSLALNYSINGAPFSAGGAGWYGVSSGSLLLIGNSQYSATGFIGTINEYLLFTRTLTATEHNQITGYLAWKWGSQSSLPANHPYKNSAPIGTTNPAGISRPANVLPIPPITCTPLSKIRTLVTQVFTYTGSIQTYTVPVGVTSVVLYMWGAGGGTSQPVGGFVNYSGGAGAMVQGVYTVTPASTLYVVVGKGGVTNQSIQTDAQGGGGAANSAGGGGGRSAIQLTSGGADVVVAGGGGGGGLLYANNNGTGGPAYFSGSSPNTLAAVTGYGGTQTAGGAGGGNGGGAGSLKFGGAGTGPGAGGGGGYYGGGGMGNGDQGWCPGGGGSSLIDNLSLIPGESVFGFNSTNLSGAPNTGSTYYVSNVAAGGIGANATGGNGRVVVGYYL